MKISFFGGAQEVTGSCFLFDSGSTKVLIDCGLFQCPKFCDARSDAPFPFDPKEISAVFVTHAHIDHTGRIPKLAKMGFKGKIFSTLPTKDLAEIMLSDSLGLLEKEALKHGVPLIYEEKDINSSMSLWKGVPYGEEISAGDLKIKLRDSGHVLGSSMVEILAGGKKIIFTGDLGNPPTPLLNDPEKVKDASVLVVESTYGDRVHEERGERKIMLERAIEETVHEKGVLMIPAFSLERTQELLAEVDDLLDTGKIPSVPIFLDSPLAIKTTAIYKKYESFFNKEAHKKIKSGDDIFHFKGLKMTLTTEESKSINEVGPPKIIIAGSGMSTGGRILHHEKRYLPDPHSTLLMVGYQGAGSMGRMLQDGAKEVRIHGEIVPVRAKIRTLGGYSSHPDRDKLVEFVASSKDTLEKVFATHGEPSSSLFFIQRVRDYLGIEAFAPRYGETYEI
ncbi:MBL fold metallo-hydrolase [Candidatus Giovannonibacteria bacterium]|nr:MBL fold metallo-hydrolase [Candidatus Giovannonibacteria bacterium]